jgi:phosphoglycolate phosphatase-like HAD superfamily hydrolase
MSNAFHLGSCKAALFDVDGTLVDSIPAIVAVLQESIQRFCEVSLTEAEVRALIGIPVRQQFQMFAPSSWTQKDHEAAYAYTIKRFGEEGQRDTIFAPALEALRAAKRAGVRIALVTSKSRPEFEALRQHIDLTGEVDAVITASDVAQPKPWPDTAFAACEALGVPPELAVFIGDTIHDIRCGKSAGTGTIGVGYGCTPAELLAAENPDLLFHSPEALSGQFQTDFNRLLCHERK